MPARLALTGWGVSVALALVVAGLLEAVDVVESTLFVGVALPTALGTLAPILRDNGDAKGRFARWRPPPARSARSAPSS